jgi:hypothetical protein
MRNIHNETVARWTLELAVIAWVTLVMVAAVAIITS